MWNWFRKKSTVQPDPADLTSEELMATCDRFWHPATIEYGEFVAAQNELWKRGPEIRDWCRRLLSHTDYAARETGASLLGQLGKRGQLGEAVEAVVAELGKLASRPVEEDGKEAQAVDAAVTALAEIGHPAGIPHVAAVLFSNNEFLGGDSAWNAAEALSQITGQSFMDSDDPVQTARDWYSSQKM